MSKESTITFNTPIEVKNKLQDLANANGLTVSDLMRMSAMQLLNRGIMIEPRLEPTNYLANAINEAEDELKKGETITVDSAQGLTNYLGKLKR